MGIYDRDYYREESRGGFTGGSLSMVTILMLINAGVFLVNLLFFPAKPGEQAQLIKWFALEPDMFSRPWEAWQLVTYGFLHDPTSIWHILMNMFVLWLFGRDIETIYGRKEFLAFYLSTIVLAGVVWLAAQTVFFPGNTGPVVGASGGCMGVAVLFACHYPKRMLLFWGVIPIPAWLIIGFYVLKDFVGFAAQTQPGADAQQVAVEAHLGGAACGALFFKTRWHLGRLLGIFGGALAGNPFGRRPRLRVHRDEAEDHDLSAQVDAILAKISREGEQSLSVAERRILEDASRRYQRRNR